jgi:hypothetical protein
MDNRKYIGMDVHQASISIAVSDDAGKVLMECVSERSSPSRVRCAAPKRRALDRSGPF